MQSKPRILTLDIETAPLESWTWGIWEQNVGVEQIKTEWSILSYAAKWLDSKKVIYADTGGYGPGAVRRDAALLVEIRALLDEADIVVAQNGQRFDIKKINARLIMHGLKPYSPIRVVDTMLVARRYFAFTSNKLAWLSKYLTDSPKSEHKLFPGFELWSEVMKDNPKAWGEMKKYNKQDVIATEKLYLQLLPWIANHPNLGVFVDGTAHVCPKCGSTDVHRNGFRATQQGKYPRYQCMSCGGWSRGKVQELPLAKRKSLLVGV